MSRSERLEQLTTYGLAAVGLVKGVGEIAAQEAKHEATNRRIRPAAIAWGVLGLEILAYDMLAPHEETFSEGVDRGLEKHKTLVTVGIAAVALHLRNLLPEPVDPIHQFAKRTRERLHA